jgi:hypothetical protein
MHEYRFRMDVFTPQTLPMQRLAEYMAELAKLLGEPERVHFVRMTEGSAVLVASVEPQASDKVMPRLQEVRQGHGDGEATKAERHLDDLLAEDNAVGELSDAAGVVIIPFPGRTRPKPLRYGLFHEDGLLEGVVIRVGGKDETVPVWLRDGSIIHKCNAPLEIARGVAKHLLTNEFLRVRGKGRWMREEDGSGTMDRFDIHEFELLDDAPLPEVVRQLHDVKGAAWGDDPIADLRCLRRGESPNGWSSSTPCS